MSLLRINTRPNARQLRLFSLGWLCFVGGFAVLQWLKGRHAVAECMGGAALLVPVVGIVWHDGVRRLYVGLCYATYPIGYVISTVVLCVLFYGVVTPLGLLLRLCGHDPLGKRAAPASASYWRPRERTQSPASYFKQY